MLARAVLVRSPDWIACNPETAATNAYQSEGNEADRLAAREQFRVFCKELRDAGIDVIEMPVRPDCPDAVFPNNWFSTTSEGAISIYPMMAASRRAERDLPGLIKALSNAGYKASQVRDFTESEEMGRYLEGTGSLVVDHWSRKAFASVSPRTDRGVATAVCNRMGWTPILFEAVDSAMQVYHTNVAMAVGSDFAVICTEAIADPAMVLRELHSSGKAVVNISRQQMRSFCGNVIELAGPIILMSAQARRAFRPDQLEILGRHRRIISPDISAIERLGGGSARCMVAEIFLPQIVH